MRRVARRVVVLTWHQTVSRRFWLLDDFPEPRLHDAARAIEIADLVDALGGADVSRWEVPHDCRDGR